MFYKVMNLYCPASRSVFDDFLERNVTTVEEVVKSYSDDDLERIRNSSWKNQQLSLESIKSVLHDFETKKAKIDLASNFKDAYIGSFSHPGDVCQAR